MDRKSNSLYRINGYKTSNKNSHNIDNTGPDPDPTFINGRQHKITKCKKGKEKSHPLLSSDYGFVAWHPSTKTYLYQPSTTEPGDYDKYEISPEMAEFYKTIDTTKKFEIRRPKVYEGFLNKLL